ncbi:MAG: NUDIX domain-containing protein [Novosphingobium sp.]|nr:NUDIX domain-containing protein [Novosphingobium sp.]
MRIVHGIRVVWWRYRKPRLAGCRVVALDGDGRVLLIRHRIRHSYGSRAWMLPGGGLRRGEDPLGAAARELAEEAGCGLIAPVLVAEVPEVLHGAGNRVHVVVGRTADVARPDRREATHAAFFAPDALPADTARGLAAAIPRWITAATAAGPPRPE